MRLTTWNVNGIRNPFGYQPWNSARTFPAMFDILETDIVVMQELKIQRKDLRDDMVLIDGWDCYFSLPKQKKGYSGVGIYTRNATCAPIHAEEGILGVLTPPNSTTAYRDLPESDHIGGYPSGLQVAELGVDPALLDSEGRCVCLEFPAFVLFGVYSPANSNGLRDDFRYGFLCALECRIRNLTKMGKRVVLVGDLNVSRSEIDTAGAAEELRKNGMTHEDYISSPNRRVFNQLIVGGEVVGERDEGREQPALMDVVRDFHPDRKGMYTHWEQKVNARPGNFGSRIDFILASTKMDGWFSDANIQEGLMGSDHCPVYGDFKDIVPIQDNEDLKEAHLLDIMNPPGVFLNGTRQKPWALKEAPPSSAKLMPEFYQRRSIKDMFKKPSEPRSDSSAPTAPLSAASTQPEPTATVSPESSNVKPTVATAAIPSTPKQVTSSPSNKRKASDASAPKPVKRQKSTSNVAAKAAPGKGQQSLTGFFQPKATSQSFTQMKKVVVNGANTTTNGDDSGIGGAPSQRKIGTDGADDTYVVSGSPYRHAESSGLSNKPSTSTLPNNSSPFRSPTKPDPPPPPSSNTFPDDLDDSSDYVHDPIVSKESWATLFRRPAAPLCESHEEPCKSMLTKKKGENQGRSFWMCARPLGPSGQKEKGTQWRCGTFIWCSDWKKDG